MLETKIFKPYNRKIDTEEWPQLQLVDAVVYRHVADKPDELCDLLDVQFTGPLRITGTVSKIPAKFNKMVKDLPVMGEKQAPPKTATALAKSVHGSTITVVDVLTYSLESYKNPKVDSTIWALGYAAWYSISPAPEYRKYFERSLEKAHAWDIVLEFGKSQEFKQVTIEQLFAKYFQKHPSCESVDGAETVFRDCRRFLVCKMLEPIDPLAGAKSKTDKARWQNFCLWKWLTANYTGIVKEVEKARQAGKTGGESSTDKRAFSLDTQHGLDSLESLALERKLKPYQLTTEWLISSIMKKSGANAKTVRSLLRGHANALSTLMALSRQVNWVQSSLYGDLLLASKEAPSGDGNGEGAGGSSHALKVKKNGGSGKGEAATASLNPFADALDGVNDMEQDNDLLSSPELSQPPRSAKGKSVLRPIMTPLQRESGQENEVSSPLSSPPASPPSTPVTVEQLVAPGPSTLPKRRHTGGATSSQEPAKRSRVSKGSPLKVTTGGDDDDDGWPPLSPGRGRPPIIVTKQISMKPIGDGTFWRCPIGGGDCLTIIPDAHIPAGRDNIDKHLNEHYSKLERASNALEEEPETGGRSLDALLDKIERMAKAWQAVKEQNQRDFHEMHAILLQRERERGEVVLHGGTPPGTPPKELDKSNEKGKGKGKGKGKEKQ